MNKYLLAFFISSLILFTISSCDGNYASENASTKTQIPTTDNTSCDDFWAVYHPEDTIKIKLLEEIVTGDKDFSSENVKLLKAMVLQLKKTRSHDSLPFIFEYPLFPIHRLGKNQIGVLGYSISQDLDGQWEGFSKEDQLLKKDFGYQSIDSMGELVFFPKVYDKLYPLTKPSIYWYSLKKKGKSTLPELAYFGDECLSYFHYSLVLNSTEKKENIVFGSPFSLDLNFILKPELDKKFKEQMVLNCIDCPSNYADQKIFAQIKGTNLYFTQADSWPTNDKLDSPSRSLVLLKKDGSIITIWNSELDLYGCGCL
jgi:hypothetical protein